LDSLKISSNDEEEEEVISVWNTGQDEIFSSQSEDSRSKIGEDIPYFLSPKSNSDHRSFIEFPMDSQVETVEEELFAVGQTTIYTSLWVF
jgi:hypothetical protein